MSGQASKCEKGSCEFTPSIGNRRLKYERSPDEIRYARLWVEMDPPKLLTTGEIEKQGIEDGSRSIK